MNADGAPLAGVRSGAPLLALLLVLGAGCAAPAVESWSCTSAATTVQDAAPSVLVAGEEAFRTLATIPSEATFVVFRWSFTDTGGAAFRAVGPNGTLVEGAVSHGPGQVGGGQAFPAQPGRYEGLVVAREHAVVTGARLEVLYQLGDRSAAHC